jgi:hypothetical protein
MNVITTGPRLDYPLHIATPGTYTLWLRGYPTNAAGDSAYVTLGDQTVEVTGFAPVNGPGQMSESAALGTANRRLWRLRRPACIP